MERSSYQDHSPTLTALIHPLGKLFKKTKVAKPSQPPSLKIKTKCTGAFCVTSMVEECCQQLASQAFLLMPQCVKDVFNDRSRTLLSVRCLSCVNTHKSWHTNPVSHKGGSKGRRDLYADRSAAFMAVPVIPAGHQL